MAVPIELQEEVLLAAFEKLGDYTSPLAKYFPTLGNPGPGKNIGYDVLAYNKAMTPLVDYTAKAPKGNMPVRSKVNFDAPTYKEALDLPVDLIKAARDVGKLTASQQAQVARALRQLRLNMERRWDFLRAAWLTAGATSTSAGVAPDTTCDGSVYLDTRYGNTAAPLAIPLGFTTSHIDSIVGASWATAATDIKADLDAAALTIMADSGVSANRVICNSTVMGYVLKCTAYTRSEYAKETVDRTGKLLNIWGYEFDVIDDTWPFDSASLATDTGAIGAVKLIPGNMCILTTANNDAAGRYMLECQPSDMRAAEGARGVYMFQDEAVEHPKAPTYGIEWTGAPQLSNPDSTYIFDDVTSTS